MTRARKGIVLRPGLVYGPAPGGVFGAIRKEVLGGKVIPLIGNGRAPQYLLHEDTLKNVMLRETVDGEFTTTEDVAAAALFVAASKSNALTGQSLIVSHGWFME